MFLTYSAAVSQQVTLLSPGLLLEALPQASLEIAHNPVEPDVKQTIKDTSIRLLLI